MRKPEAQKLAPLQDIESRDGARGAIRALYTSLADFLRRDDEFKKNVVAELNPLYGELDWTPVEIAAGAEGLITIPVPGAILGYAADVSYDQGIGGLGMSYPHVVNDGVEVFLTNGTGAPVTLNAGRFRAYVWARVLTE